MAEKKIMDRTEKKKSLTLFMIIIFSVLLAMTSAIQGAWTRLIFQIILLTAQMLIVKNLLDDFYNTNF